jgi:hypothetical protein
MVKKTAAMPQAAFPSVKKSAKWNSRIIEKCLGRLVGGRIAFFIWIMATRSTDTGRTGAISVTDNDRRTGSDEGSRKAAGFLERKRDRR